MMFRLSPRHAAALAATLVVVPALQAAQPTEAQLRSIKLYGDTTIAEDSVGRWGFWEQFEPPAAGGSPAVSVAAAPASWYRPLATVTAPSAPVTPTAPALVLPCESGGLCGFGMFMQAEAAAPSPEIVIPVEQAAGTAREKAAALAPESGFSLHPYVFSATEVAGANEGTYPYPATVTLNPVALGSQAVPGAHAATVSMDDGWGSYYGPRISASMQPDSEFMLIDAEVAWYVGSVRGESETKSYTGIFGVTGRLTSAADMDALNKGNVQAFYSGRLMSERSMDVADNVQLTVDFGQRTFTGSVNGGRDTSALNASTLASGQTVLLRGVGFNIDGGTISGSTFQATRLSATDGTVTGQVVGGFFGPSAAAAGGVVDVTKTRTGEAPYTTGRLVMPFLTQRTDLRNEK